MNLETFVRWVLSLDDDPKRAIARRAREARATSDARFLGEGRAEAEDAIQATPNEKGLDPAMNTVMASAAPDN